MVAKRRAIQLRFKCILNAYIFSELRIRSVGVFIWRGFEQEPEDTNSAHAHTHTYITHTGKLAGSYFIQYFPLGSFFHLSFFRSQHAQTNRGTGTVHSSGSQVFESCLSIHFHGLTTFLLPPKKQNKRTQNTFCEASGLRIKFLDFVTEYRESAPK